MNAIYKSISVFVSLAIFIMAFGYHFVVDAEAFDEDQEVPMLPMPPTRAIKLLGEGGNKQIVLYRHNQAHGRLAAFTVVDRNSPLHYGARIQYYLSKEISGTVAIFGQFFNQERSTYYMPYFTEGDLYDAVREEGLAFDLVMELATQTCSTMVMMHDRDIVHRDIKPENIFVSQKTTPPSFILADFDYALHLGDKFTSSIHFFRRAFTDGFASPEYKLWSKNIPADAFHKNSPYWPLLKRNDYWAFGRTVLEAMYISEYISTFEAQKPWHNLDDYIDDAIYFNEPNYNQFSKNAVWLSSLLKCALDLTPECAFEEICTSSPITSRPVVRLVSPTDKRPRSASP